MLFLWCFFVPVLRFISTCSLVKSQTDRLCAQGTEPFPSGFRVLGSHHIIRNLLFACAFQGPSPPLPKRRDGLSPTVSAEAVCPHLSWRGRTAKCRVARPPESSLSCEPHTARSLWKSYHSCSLPSHTKKLNQRTRATVSVSPPTQPSH